MERDLRARFFGAAKAFHPGKRAREVAFHRRSAPQNPEPGTRLHFRELVWPRRACRFQGWRAKWSRNRDETAGALWTSLSREALLSSGTFMSQPQESSPQSLLTGLPTGGSIRYEPCIDGWRAAAAVMVLVAHFFPLREPPNTWMQMGGVGVTVFFIISGYLITQILFQAKEQVADGRLSKGAALKRFYIRRVLRIAPVYYASILAMCLIGSKPMRDYVWWHLTYMTNFGHVFCGIDFRNMVHFWTLAVEEQFYLVWPLVILSLARKRVGPAIRWLFASSAALCVIGGACGLSSYGMIMSLPIGGPSLALGYGAALAYGRYYEGSGCPRLARFSLGLGLPFFALSQVVWWWHGGQPAINFPEYRLLYPWSVTLFFGWLFVRSLNQGSMLNRFLSHPVLRYFGRISYGVYVYHMLLDGYYYSIWARLGFSPSLSPVAEGFLKSATSILIAAGSWHFFEKPILSLKKRWAPDSGTPPRTPRKSPVG